MRRATSGRKVIRPEGRGRFVVRLALVSLAASPCAPALESQERTPTDRSLAASLAAVSMPSPAGPAWAIGDSARSASATRFDLAWGRAVRGPNGNRHETAVLGLRREWVERDSAGTRASAGYGGVRVGVRAGDAGTTTSISALELYGGIRSQVLPHAAVRPDGGIDAVVGWGGFGENTRASVALRLPVELGMGSRGTRISLFAAPTMAWGYIRMRSCEDLGPDDNCGDLHLQLAWGQTRYIFSGGISAAVERIGVAASAGVQRLVAPGEVARLWIGVSVAPPR